MPKMIIAPPNIKQKLFLNAKAKNIGYGGARGGGKSWAIRTKAKLLCMAYKGIRILIVRKTYPELKKNHVDVLCQELCPKFAKYNSSEKRFVFNKSRSIIELMYCRNDKDLEEIQGAEYDCIFIDEATQLSEFQLKAIAACCRGTNGYPKHIYYTCNPGGQGHAYIKRVFIDRIFNEGENPDDFEFTQALVQDNEILMQMQPDYIAQLEALPPKLKKGWLYGSWDIFEGQYFEDFINDPEHYIDRKYTHVIEPFSIPPAWKIYRSYDFGYSKPFSCAWWAVDYDGRLYRILELYGCTKVPNEGVKWDPNTQFSEIQKIEHQHPYLKGKKIRGVADPAIWNAETGKSIANTAQEYGIYFEKGDNQRISGWMQMHYRFAFDENGIPMMYIFSNCKAFIRTVPLMMYDETHTEDLDTDLEDHVCDETRYECMSRPIAPAKVKKTNEIMDDPLNQRIPKHRSIYIMH